MTPNDRTLELVNTLIDAQAERAAKAWREDIAHLANEAVEIWHREHSDVDEDIFRDLHQPALLWKFCEHLAQELSAMGDGWEGIFYANLRERDR